MRLYCVESSDLVVFRSELVVFRCLHNFFSSLSIKTPLNHGKSIRAKMYLGTHFFTPHTKPWHLKSVRSFIKQKRKSNNPRQIHTISEKKGFGRPAAFLLSGIVAKRQKIRIFATRKKIFSSYHGKRTEKPHKTKRELFAVV